MEINEIAGRFQNALNEVFGENRYKVVVEGDDRTPEAIADGSGIGIINDVDFDKLFVFASHVIPGALYYPEQIGEAAAHQVNDAIEIAIKAIAELMVRDHFKNLAWCQQEEQHECL